MEAYPSDTCMGQTSPRGQSYNVNRNVTSFICCKFQVVASFEKMALKYNFKHFFHDLIVIYIYKIMKHFFHDLIVIYIYKIMKKMYKIRLQRDFF